jgi:hypothetical protein
VLQIGRLVRKSIGLKTPFSKEQLLRQADFWFNEIITTREKIPRNLPPSEEYVKKKGAKDGIYTIWGWDRQCDLSYVSAIWEMGINKKVHSSSFVRLRLTSDAWEERGSRKIVR